MVFFGNTDINKGIEKMNQTDGAMLIDVRTQEEYLDAHIPGSINIPLDELEIISDKIPDKNKPVFVYCQSGGRSLAAQHILKKSGYSNVTNIGGICNYKGRVQGGEEK